MRTTGAVATAGLWLASAVPDAARPAPAALASPAVPDVATISPAGPAGQGRPGGRDPSGSLGLETALQPAPACGDLVLLDRLVANLVDNAVRHNIAGGWIQVTTGTRDGQAYLTVTNGGPVIAEDWPRCCSSRSGGWTGRRAAGPGRGWACPSSGR